MAALSRMTEEELDGHEAEVKIFLLTKEKMETWSRTVSDRINKRKM